jgi:hypothetical protein
VLSFFPELLRLQFVGRCNDIHCQSALRAPGIPWEFIPESTETTED